MKDKLDDEIKLAGPESLVPEELEKHLFLNSNRLGTFEDARLEVVTYVEVKFGLIIQNSKPSDTGARGHQMPWMLIRSTLSSGRGKGSSSPRDGCFKCGGAHFQRDYNARKSTGKQSYGEGKQSKSWSKSEGKGKITENKEKSKATSNGTKGATRAKHQKLVSQVLITRNRRQARKLRNLHRHLPLTLLGTMVGMVTNETMDGVLMNGMMTGFLLDGTKVGNKRKTLPQAFFAWRSGCQCHQ